MNNIPGFLANQPLTANFIETARQQRLEQNLPLIDLTDSNSTNHDLIFPPEILTQATKQYFSHRIYQPEPKGLLTARQSISDYYAQRSPSLSIPAEQIFITSSTSEAYALLFSLLCNPNDNVLVPQISYPLIDLLAEHSKINPFPCKQLNDFTQTDLKSLELAINNQTRAIVLISPNNPTGKVITSIDSSLTNLTLPIICDEVFADFPYKLASVPPLASLLDTVPIFHLNGISKMYALADLKLSWIALNKMAYDQFGERLTFLNDTFLSCNQLTQTILPTIFSTGVEFQSSLKQHIKSNLDYLIKHLSNQNSITIDAPDAGQFLVITFQNQTLDEDSLVLKLIETGVLVQPGYFYGFNQGTQIVISCIPKRKILEDGLQRLLAIIRS